jgi:hypothetical protein
MAGRPPIILRARNAFDAVRHSSDNLVQAVRPYLIISYTNKAGALTRKQAERIVSYSFLTLMGSWEEFVYAAYIRYLVGSGSPSGYRPTLISARKATLLAAYRHLTQKPNHDPTSYYHSWKSWNNVVQSAGGDFINGEPFSLVATADRACLGYAQNIRNRVAHRSERCIHNFKESARHHLGLQHNAKLPKGTDAGRLLSSQVTHVFPPGNNRIYYDEYSAMLERLSRIIAP